MQLVGRWRVLYFSLGLVDDNKMFHMTCHCCNNVEPDETYHMDVLQCEPSDLYNT